MWESLFRLCGKRSSSRCSKGGVDSVDGSIETLRQELTGEGRGECAKKPDAADNDEGPRTSGELSLTDEKHINKIFKERERARKIRDQEQFLNDAVLEYAEKEGFVQFDAETMTWAANDRVLVLDGFQDAEGTAVKGAQGIVHGLCKDQYISIEWDTDGGIDGDRVFIGPRYFGNFARQEHVIDSATRHMGQVCAATKKLANEDSKWFNNGARFLARLKLQEAVAMEKAASERIIPEVVEKATPEEARHYLKVELARKRDLEYGTDSWYQGRRRFGDMSDMPSLNWRMVAKALPEIHKGSNFELNISNNSIDDEAFVVLVKAMAQRTWDSKALSFKGNRIGDAGAAALAKEVAKMANRLQFLDLGGNRIGDDGIKELAPGLKLVPYLTNLYLAGNSFGNEGAKALAEPLEQMKQLETLSIDKDLFPNIEHSILKSVKVYHKSI